MQRLNNESALFKTQKSCVKLKLESIQGVISIKIQCVYFTVGRGLDISEYPKMVLVVADESEAFTRHVVTVKFPCVG